MKRLILIVIAVMSLGAGYQAPDYESIADAIYHAEGGIKASRPYGIMREYCTKDKPDRCRKGCIQTIQKRYRMWQDERSTAKGSETFISYLAMSYAPLNANNDPSGLNANWIKNVSYYLDNPKEVSHV